MITTSERFSEKSFDSNNHIEDKHFTEWINSGIDSELIALNVCSLSGNNPYERLLYGLDDSARRNDGRLTDRWLKQYRHLEDGGWWCSGIDILTGQESPWGCFKPNRPRISHQKHKPIKYENPPLVPTEIFALCVTASAWRKIADRFGIVMPSDRNLVGCKDISVAFWQWVKDNPRLSIIITEGVKKAGALLSAGYCAIALPSINNGYRNDDGTRQLIAQLVALCTINREFVFAFDSDKKYSTREAVTQAIVNTGKLLQEKGCKVSVTEWDADFGKGVDDLIVSQGSDYFETVFEDRSRLSEYEEAKKKKTVRLDAKKLLDFTKGEFEERLRFDDRKRNVLLDGEVFEVNNQKKFWFVENYGYDCGREDFVDCILFVAQKNTINPVKQYLIQCHKDAKRISIDNLATRYFGTDDPLYDEMVKRWLIGAVARVNEPGCQMDYALILQGKTGIFKSTFFQTLGGEWFDDSIKDISSDDALLTLDRSWIQELAELDRITKRKEAADIKAFITRRNDVFRKKYDREVSEHPRRSVLCGSVNKDSFLLDETGNRRFWVIPVSPIIKHIDIKQLAAEQDGIWASAVDAYLAGEKPMLSDALEAQSALNNQMFEVHDEWESVIAYYLNGREAVSISEILSEAFSLEPAKHDRQTQMRVSSILVKLGWSKGGRRIHQNKKQNVWVLAQK